MATKIFTALVAMMITVSMSASNSVKKNTTAVHDHDLPGVTVTAKRNTIQVIYNNTKKLEYNLDGKGRVASKVVYAGHNDGWSPVSAYSVFYGEKETVLTYAEYDDVHKTYTRNPKQTIYDANEYPEIIRVPNIK